MNEPKFCKDCKHCVIENGKLEYAKCTASVKHDFHGDYLVDGVKREPDLWFCATVRKSADANDCGLDGKKFEPKDTK